MPRRPTVRVPRDRGLTDIEPASYGRKAPSERSARLSSGQIAEIERTVRRVPEVMVKVSGGGKDVGGAKAHLDYIDRHGKLEIHTDDGQILHGKDAGQGLVDDWHLDTIGGQYRPLTEGGEDRRAKVAHNIVLSMPAPTPPEKVLAAAERFAREKFALQHRYAMVLHADQKHPHVHLIVKAESEQGKRLYIRKATLRGWRRDFAQCMREQGVAANATPHAIRGQSPSTRKDGIYRATQRGESTFMRERVETVAKELQAGRFKPEPGKGRLLQTRRQVVAGWTVVTRTLREQGEVQLAAQVDAFVRSMPRVMTDRERIAVRLLGQVEAQRRGMGEGAAQSSTPAAPEAPKGRGE
jgi:hypothetical protein